jgi:rRNA-processing protein FCF1
MNYDLTYIVAATLTVACLIMIYACVVAELRAL